MKMAMTEMPPGLVMVFRYGLTLLFFSLAGQLRFNAGFSKREWLLILGIGILNFSVSPFFQLKALQLTQTADVAIIVAFEPLVVTLLAILLLKERLKKRTLFTFLCATLGVLVMSGWKGNSASLDTVRLFGNFLFLCSVLCEGLYTISSRHLVQKYHPYRIMAWMILAGFLGNLIGNYPLLTSAALQNITWKGWSSLFYLSFLATFIAYTGWVFILKRATVVSVSWSLFLQPIFGTFWGVLFLKETYGWENFFGASLILLSLFIGLVPHLRTKFFGRRAAKAHVTATK